jgi:uncharacterized membrane protein
MAARSGPSKRARQWRRFLIETLLCIVLLAAIVVVWARGRSDFLAGSATVALVGLILRILWHPD